MIDQYSINVPPLTDRAFWDSIRDNGEVASLRQLINDIALTAGDRPNIPSASDYLAARRSNDRARIDRFWQTGRGVLAALVFQRCLSGLESEADNDRLLNHLWEHLTHPTWAVVAHLPNQDLPSTKTPTLDLAACEMAANLAETREALLPWINQNSSTLGDSILHEIDSRVLTPFGDGSKTNWSEAAEPNNWLGVCAGSILAACESLANQGHPRPIARKRAIECLGRYIQKGFTENGECDEGVNYWAYGMGFASIGWSRLKPREMASAVDLQRFRTVASYPARANLFDNEFFAGNDASSHVEAPAYFSTWLSAAAGSDFLSNWSATGPIPTNCRTFSQLIRTAIALQKNPLLFRNVPAKSKQTAPAAKLLLDQQVAIITVKTSDGDLIASLTGGHNDERHNHNDLGNITVFFAGKALIPDLGAPVYTADYFGPNRYQQLPASSRGHSCPVINGHEQLAGWKAHARILDWDAKAATFKLDLTLAYPDESKLVLWQRSLSANADFAGVTILDEFKTAPGSVISHVLWSTVRPTQVGGQFVLSGMQVALSPKPDSVKIIPVEPASLHLRDFSQTLYRIEANYRADSGLVLIKTDMTALHSKALG